MQTVIIVIHLMIVTALIGVVLLQRSEGGGLGIGGGSGFMTARGAANALTRATAILATIFFATSLILSIVARYGEKPIDILDRLPASNQDSAGQSGGGKGVLDQLPGSTAPAAPANQATPPTDGGSATTAPATAPATEPQANAPTMAPQAPAAPATEAPATDGGAMKPAAPQVPNQ